MASKIIVCIEDEEFDLFKSPPADSMLVKQQAESVGKDVNYDLISAQTNNLALSLRVAYLGVARFPMLQKKVNDLSFNVTKLSDDSVRVLQKFQRAASSINQSYISACKYLLKGKEKLGMMEFGNVFTKADEMRKAVCELATKYGDSSEVAKSVYEDVQNEVQRRDDTTSEMRQVEQEIRDIESLIDKTEKELREAQEREDRARERMGSLGRKFVTAFTGKGDTDEKEFNKYLEERVKIQDKIRDMRIKHQSKLLEKLKKASVLKPHENTQIHLENSALSALDCCVKGMKHAQAILLNVAQFWKQVADINKDFSPDGVKKHIDVIQEDEDAADRLEMFNEEGFQRKIKCQQATWVALGIASNRCLESIQTSNRELHVFLGEHYAPDQALQKLQELMGEFMRRSEALIQAMIADNPSGSSASAIES